MSRESHLCSVAELSHRLTDANLRILDASWYLPSAGRHPKAEYLTARIPGAVYFDIDEVCDLSSDLPHMLPSAVEFAKSIGEMGIDNQSKIVVYDTAGLFSAARVWWMFNVFGHQDVQVLNGGLPEWIAQGMPLDDATKSVKFDKKVYSAQLDETFLVTLDVLRENCELGELTVLDARSQGRFDGTQPEPRPELSSGHMPNSISVPFDELLCGGKLKSKQKLREQFEALGIAKQAARNNIVTSCGSGVTAAIITLALAEAGFGMQRLYDGAWAEWASAPSAVILSGA